MMATLGPLISTHDLSKLLQAPLANGPSVRVLDGTWHNPRRKRDCLKEYREAHIPGAGFFNPNECRDKSSPYSVMLPTPEVFAEYVGHLGINNDTHVIVYDTYNGLEIAPRTWWMFRIFGHGKVSVLEGGLTKWTLDGYKVESEVPTFSEEEFTVSFRPDLRVEYEEMYSLMKNGQTSHMIDSRPSDWYYGRENLEKWKSWHIPGSVNIPWSDFLKEGDESSMKSKEELVELFRSHQIDLSAPIQSTCRRGIYACTAALGLFMAGREDVPVYDGSWEEFTQRTRQEEYMEGAEEDF